MTRIEQLIATNNATRLIQDNKIEVTNSLGFGSVRRLGVSEGFEVLEVFKSFASCWNSLRFAQAFEIVMRLIAFIV